MKIGGTGASLAALVGSLFLTTCAENADSGVVVYEAEYLSYESVDDLWGAADLVVAASISQDPTVARVDIESSDGSEEDADEGGDVYTVFLVEVTHVWKGSAVLGETLEVKQLGGQYDGVLYVEEDQPALATDADYLLFLATFQDLPGVPASLLNPSQGQYRLGGSGEPVALAGNDLAVSTEALDDLAEQE